MREIKVTGLFDARTSTKAHYVLAYGACTFSTQKSTRNMCVEIYRPIVSKESQIPFSFRISAFPKSTEEERGLMMNGTDSARTKVRRKNERVTQSSSKQANIMTSLTYIKSVLLILGKYISNPH